MSEHETQGDPAIAGRRPARPPVSQPGFCKPTLRGLPLDLLILLLGIPLIGVAVAMILPAVRILRAWLA